MDKDNKKSQKKNNFNDDGFDTDDEEGKIEFIENYVANMFKRNSMEKLKRIEAPVQILEEAKARDDIRSEMDRFYTGDLIATTARQFQDLASRTGDFIGAAAGAGLATGSNIVSQGGQLGSRLGQQAITSGGQLGSQALRSGQQMMMTTEDVGSQAIRAGGQIGQAGLILTGRLTIGAVLGIGAAAQHVQDSRVLPRAGRAIGNALVQVPGVIGSTIKAIGESLQSINDAQHDFRRQFRGINYIHGDEYDTFANFYELQLRMDEILHDVRQHIGTDQLVYLAMLPEEEYEQLQRDDFNLSFSNVSRQDMQTATQTQQRGQRRREIRQDFQQRSIGMIDSFLEQFPNYFQERVDSIRMLGLFESVNRTNPLSDRISQVVNQIMQSTDFENVQYLLNNDFQQAIVDYQNVLGGTTENVQLVEAMGFAINRQISNELQGEQQQQRQVPVESQQVNRPNQIQVQVPSRPNSLQNSINVSEERKSFQDSQMTADSEGPGRANLNQMIIDEDDKQDQKHVQVGVQKRVTLAQHLGRQEEPDTPFLRRNLLSQVLRYPGSLEYLQQIIQEYNLQSHELRRRIEGIAHRVVTGNFEDLNTERLQFQDAATQLKQLAYDKSQAISRRVQQNRAQGANSEMMHRTNRDQYEFRTVVNARSEENQRFQSINGSIGDNSLQFGESVLGRSNPIRQQRIVDRIILNQPILPIPYFGRDVQSTQYSQVVGTPQHRRNPFQIPDIYADFQLRNQNSFSDFTISLDSNLMLNRSDLSDFAGVFEQVGLDQADLNQVGQGLNQLDQARLQDSQSLGSYPSVFDSVNIIHPYISPQQLRQVLRINPGGHPPGPPGPPGPQPGVQSESDHNRNSNITIGPPSGGPSISDGGPPGSSRGGPPSGSNQRGQGRFDRQSSFQQSNQRFQQPSAAPGGGPPPGRRGPQPQFVPPPGPPNGGGGPPNGGGGPPPQNPFVPNNQPPQAAIRNPGVVGGQQPSLDQIVERQNKIGHGLLRGASNFIEKQVGDVQRLQQFLQGQIDNGQLSVHSAKLVYKQKFDQFAENYGRFNAGQVELQPEVAQLNIDNELLTDVNTSNVKDQLLNINQLTNQYAASLFAKPGVSLNVLRNDLYQGINHLNGALRHLSVPNQNVVRNFIGKQNTMLMDLDQQHVQFINNIQQHRQQLQQQNDADDVASMSEYGLLALAVGIAKSGVFNDPKDTVQNQIDQKVSFNLQRKVRMQNVNKIRAQRS